MRDLVSCSLCNRIATCRLTDSFQRDVIELPSSLHLWASNLFVPDKSSLSWTKDDNIMQAAVYCVDAALDKIGLFLLPCTHSVSPFLSSRVHRNRWKCASGFCDDDGDMTLINFDVQEDFLVAMLHSEHSSQEGVPCSLRRIFG